MKSSAVAIACLMTLICTEVHAHEKMWASWCIDSVDRPTKIRQVSKQRWESGGCDIYVDEPYENVESEMTFSEDNVSPGECSKKFLEAELQLAEDGFACGGAFYVGNTDWDIKPAMDGLLKNIAAYQDAAAKKISGGMVVFEVTPYFNFEDWEWNGDDPPKQLDDQGNQVEIEDEGDPGPEEQFKDDPQVLVTFGVDRPYDTDMYNAFIAPIDGTTSYLDAADPTRDSREFPLLDIGQRSTNPCHAGDELQIEGIDRDGSFDLILRGEFDVHDTEESPCGPNLRFSRSVSPDRTYTFWEDRVFKSKGVAK